MNLIYYIIFFLLFTFKVSAQEWELNGLKISNENNISKINIDQLSFSSNQLNVYDLQYKCSNSTRFYPVHKCENGQVSFTINKVKYNFSYSGWLDLLNYKWLVKVENYDNTLSIKLDSNNIHSIAFKIENLDLEKLTGLLGFQSLFDGLSGQLNSDLIIDFKNNISISLNYSIQEFNWESTNGDYVFANTKFDGQVSAIDNSGIIEIDSELNIESGESLIKDLYISFDQYPIQTQSSLEIHDESIIKSKTNIFSDGIFNAIIEIPVWGNDNFPVDLNINYNIDDFDKFYKGYLASYFELLGVSKGVFSGKINGTIELQKNKLKSIVTSIKDLNGNMPSKKINIDGLNGVIQWRNSSQFISSLLSWESLLIAGLPLKNAKIEFQSNNNEVILKNNTKIPVFDGFVIINDLHLKSIFDPFIEIDFNGEVLPISLELITRKLDWPVMSGKISGTIPGMKKVGQSIKFLGELDLKVFNGQMKISNLSTERLFGIAPVIAANIAYNDLNLQQITSTYDFGEITGLVDGHVNGLRITNWKADRLDAYIISKKVKGLKQTISQRALDNISSIGGVQGAISNSFLKFFDRFKFSKLAIGCKLRNSVCEMSGIESSKDGYFLVKGKGIPRINIVGYRKFIDWEVFLDRLLNANF